MKTLILVALLITAGCVKEGQSTVSSTNGEYDVKLLFIADGCKVYRFYDANYRYFVKCADGKDTAVQWTESCGKGCSLDVNIKTNKCSGLGCGK